MASTTFVQVLYCLVPILPLLCFVALSAFTLVSQCVGNKVQISRFVAFPVKVLFILLSAAYACQLWLLSRTYWRLHQDILPSDQFLYSAGSIAVFLVVGAASDRPWYGYAWTSVAAIILEILLLGSTQNATELGLYLRVAQVSILAFTLTLSLSALLHRTLPRDEEEQPLLSNGSNKKNEGNGTAARRGSGTDEDDELETEGMIDKQIYPVELSCANRSPDSSRDAFMKKKQAERLASSGSWWGYIKPYGIFWPYLLPRRNAKMQFCFVVMMCSLVLDRILKVLLPRQVGIVTSRLSDSQITGQAPYTEIIIWLLLSWINSPSGFSLVDSMASNRFQEYLNAQLTSASLHHVLHLSMDFHDDADSQEVMLAVRQGSAVTRWVMQSYQGLRSSS